MRHSQLIAFHHVAKHNSFSRAAEALFLTQPAVSEQVRKLEQEFDVQLFSREHRQIRPTSAGTELFQLTRQLFEVEDRIKEHLSHSRAALDGNLRIIVDSAHHIADTLSRFRTRHPNVFVRIRVGNTAEVIEALRNYTAEIGVLGSQITSRDMLVCDLGSNQIIACSGKNFPLPDTPSLSLKELAALPLVFREKGSRTRQKMQEAASERGIKLSPILEIEGREAMREVIASGAGIGFVSEAEFGHDDRLVPIPIKDVDIWMSETLICMKQRREVRAIRAFMRVAETL